MTLSPAKQQSIQWAHTSQPFSRPKDNNKCLKQTKHIYRFALSISLPSASFIFHQAKAGKDVLQSNGFSGNSFWIMQGICIRKGNSSGAKIFLFAHGISPKITAHMMIWFNLELILASNLKFVFSIFTSFLELECIFRRSRGLRIRAIFIDYLRKLPMIPSVAYLFKKKEKRKKRKSGMHFTLLFYAF